MYLARMRASLFGVPNQNSELRHAQVRAFSAQVPAMYTIAVVSMLALAYTHLPYAPLYLVLSVPAFLVPAMLVRGFLHLRNRNKPMNGKLARRRLKISGVFAVFVGVVFSWWAMSLFPYGDAYTQGQIAFFASMITLGCIPSFIYFRSAAVGLMIVAVMPFAVFFMLTGIPVFIVIAVNLIVVAAVSLFTMLGHSREFVDLIAHQNALEEKQVEAEELFDANSRLANLDSLTGLPSRHSFFTYLSSKLWNPDRNADNALVVGILDLDGFKPINDVYGHPTGDRFLIEVGIRLSELFGEEVFIARLGGDEFGLIIEGKYTDEELHALGDRICEVIRVPFDIQGYIAHLGSSIGLARCSGCGDTAEGLFEKADYALYHAKEHARGRTIIFNEQHAEQIREVSSVERRLRDANLEKEMTLVFQPIIETSDTEAIGFEVLARWNNPEIGSIPPSVFIKSAERAGLITLLTEVLLKKALEEASRWTGNAFLSFNLSAQDIVSSETVIRLMSVVTKSGFDPKRIVFEVTETAVMSDFEQAKKSLILLRRFGARIALDDFGTGYSSLSCVRELPLDKLKLDQGFITDIVDSETSRAIVRTMVDLCQSLELECIVEGVETEQQLSVLQAMGCTIIQGYFFSRPLNPAGVANYLRAEQKIRNAG